MKLQNLFCILGDCHVLSRTFKLLLRLSLRSWRYCPRAILKFWHRGVSLEKTPAISSRLFSIPLRSLAAYSLNIPPATQVSWGLPTITAVKAWPIVSEKTGFTNIWSVLNCDLSHSFSDRHEALITFFSCRQRPTTLAPSRQPKCLQRVSIRALDWPGLYI